MIVSDGAQPSIRPFEGELATPVDELKDPFPDRLAAPARQQVDSRGVASRSRELSIKLANLLTVRHEVRVD